MAIDTQFAFVDEYGDPSLETKLKGVTQYFIVTAVLVSSESVDTARTKAEQLRSHYFQKGEMKSSGIGNADKRRLQVLRGIANLPIQFFSIAVDKDQINKDSGLVYKQSFLKFIASQLYRRLYSVIRELHVIADEHGRPEFMTSFERYIDQNCIPDLFNQSSIEFASSAVDPLLQVADIISGSLARYFDPCKMSERSKEFIEVLSPITTEILEWPPAHRALDPQLRDSRTDNSLRQVATDQAALFLFENTEPSSDDVIAQCSVLRYFLYYLNCIDETKYVPTKRLLEVLNDENAISLSEHHLRSTVIAPLRDSGLLIASSQRGYKIPISVNEILDFVDHASNIIHPLLDRVRTARTQVMLATGDSIDILEGDKYNALRKLLSDHNTA